jgi:hypothetical protein
MGGCGRARELEDLLGGDGHRVEVAEAHSLLSLCMVTCHTKARRSDGTGAVFSPVSLLPLYTCFTTENPTWSRVIKPSANFSHPETHCFPPRGPPYLIFGPTLSYLVAYSNLPKDPSIFFLQ